MSNTVWVSFKDDSEVWETDKIVNLNDKADTTDLRRSVHDAFGVTVRANTLKVFLTQSDSEPLDIGTSLCSFFVNSNEVENTGPGQTKAKALIVLTEDGGKLQLLNRIIELNEGRRRRSLEKEKDRPIPEVHEKKREDLGEYLKFVNREDSINILLKHAAEQYDLYQGKGGVKSHQIQWAACSGGPGLGKTTFCRKAFTKAIDSLPEACGNDLWKDVKKKDEFLPIVEACVLGGRQYRINFGGRVPDHQELDDPERSFAYRLLGCLTKGTEVPKVSLMDTPKLQDVLLGLTKGSKDCLIVVNFDETNIMLKMGGAGNTYLMQILSAIQKFNDLQQGFVFPIMSGTNVRDLHDVLKAASDGNAPLEIPLPLLKDENMVDVLEDLSNRCAGESTVQANGEVGEGLKFVLSVLGGVPRYIEVLAFLLGKVDHHFKPSQYVNQLQHPPPPQLLLTNIRDIIGVQYGSDFLEMAQAATTKAWTALVSASLFEWGVGRDDEFGTLTIRQMESKGILFVKTTGDTQTILFPLLFLTYILGTSEQVPMLLRHFDVKLSPDENERNTLAILLLKCKALKVMNQNITVDRLLPGLAPNLHWRHLPLQFETEKLELRQMENQITLKTWKSFEEDLKSGEHGFLVNAQGAPFSDTLIIPKGADNVILIQEKQSELAKQKFLNDTAVPYFGKPLVDFEHNKCNIKTSHLFIIVSDKKFNEKDVSKIADNEIVLPMNKHKEALGPLLSLLHLHNHHYSAPRIPIKKRKYDEEQSN